MAKKPKPTRAWLEQRIGELETRNAMLRDQVERLTASATWSVYGVVHPRSSRRRALTTDNLYSYEDARLLVVKAALEGRVEAAIVFLPFGNTGRDREAGRTVHERVNGGRAWWE